MNWIRIGRSARSIRLRLQWRQSDLSERAHVSRSAVSLLERGLGDRLTMRVVEVIVSALGGRFDARIAWNGVKLDRLLDAGHAALQAAVKEHLEAWGWIVRAEVSFNHYGERGRIDLLAWHPATSTVLIVEVKTDLVDAQHLLGHGRQDPARADAREVAGLGCAPFRPGDRLRREQDDAATDGRHRGTLR